MRILIAPDKFKGSLSASEAAEAMRRGALGAVPNADVELCPLSDGGDGLLRVLVAALGGSVRLCNVCGPLGEPVEAEWALLADGTAIIESAAAVGLRLVPPERRAATRTTSYGVGELIREALSASARSILVGLGGTATTDGGAGMAQALGVRLDGVSAPVLGGDLGNVRQLDLTLRDPRIARTPIVVLTDVDNPLTGPEGAARVYGPQKGATELEQAALDAALEHLACVAGDAGRSPGDGAAGGLGYGLRVFAGARLQSGIDTVIGLTDFERKLESSDLVLTGEGRLDAQSARGKVVAGVSRRCRAGGIPAIALVGSIGPGADALRAKGLTAYYSLRDSGATVTEAMENAAVLLESLARDVVREWAERER